MSRTAAEQRDIEKMKEMKKARADRVEEERARRRAVNIAPTASQVNTPVTEDYVISVQLQGGPLASRQLRPTFTFLHMALDASGNLIIVSGRDPEKIALNHRNVSICTTTSNHCHTALQMALDAALLHHLRPSGVRETHPETLAERILAAADVLGNETMFWMHGIPPSAMLEHIT